MNSLSGINLLEGDIKTFYWAIERNQSELVRILLDDGRIDPTFEGSFAINYAISKGYVDIVRLFLVDNRAEVSEYELWVTLGKGSKARVDINKLLTEYKNKAKVI